MCNTTLSRNPFRLSKACFDIGFTKCFLICFMLIQCSLQLNAQVVNVTQAGVIEGGYGAIPNLNGASCVFVKDNYAYVVGTGDVLEILDITLPGLPVHKGSIANGVGGANILRPQAVVVSGNYAYITSFGGNALEIIDVSNPSQPVHKASISDGGGAAPFLNQPWGLTVIGDYAYVVSNVSNALEIIDISNPGQPVHKGSLTDGGGVAPFLRSPLSITVKDNYAYIGLGGGGAPGSGGFEIIDVSNPAMPKHQGFLADGAGSAPYLRGIYSVTVKGSYAYMTDQITGALEIVNVTNPAQPVHTGSLRSVNTFPQTMVNPFCIAVSGDYAYVVGQAISGLTAIDIRNPASPAYVSSAFQNSAFSSRSVFINGNKAYVPSRQNNSLSIVDITDPSLSKLISTIKSGAGGALLTNPRSIYISDTYAYVASRQDRALEVLDISNPSVPVHKSSLVNGTGGARLDDPVSVVVAGGYAYVANNAGATIEIVDVADPSVPKHKATLTLAEPNNTIVYYPNDIFLAGNYLYIVSGDPIGQNFNNGQNNSLLIVDISNPSTPVVRGKITDGSGGAILKRPSSVYVSGSYAYVTGFESNSLEIINISNPLAPVHWGSIINGAGGALLDKPNAVYISDLSGAPNNGLPASATLLAFVVSGNSADGTGSNALEIINVTNPSLPTHVSSLRDGSGPAPYLLGPTAIQVSGGRAFITSLGRNALEVINVANPSAPSHEESLLNGDNGALLSSPTDLFVAGNYIYMTISGLYNAVNIAYLYGPSISNFTPLSGTAGTPVTITGQNFNTFITASINGLNVPITQVNETSITATIPAGAAIGRLALSYRGQQTNTVSNFIVTPTALSALNIDPTTFTATWSNVGAREYFLDVSDDEFQTVLSGYNNIPVAGTQLNVTGFQPGKAYQYRVRSSDGITLSGNSNIVTALTLTLAPATLLATQVTENSFIANWSPVAGASGYYLDVVARDDSFTSQFLNGYTNLDVAGSSNSSQVITGLSPYTSYYYRIRAYNATGSSVFSNIMNVVTVDNTAPVISPSSTPNASVITSGFSPVFTINLTDNVRIDTAKIFYRGIAENEFKSVPLQNPQFAGDSYSIVIPSNWLDALGIEYYFAAKDPAGNTTVTPSRYAQQNSISLSLPALPTGSLAKDYRIVSFPYRVNTGNAVTTVYDGVPWNDNARSALYWWDPSTAANGKYLQYDGAAFQTIDPGKGYWALVKDPFTPQLTNITAPNYNRANLFAMTLKPGWNQVGNPYPVNIQWDDVIDYNRVFNPSAIFSQLYVFNGDGYQPATGDLALKAFEGGFVRNLGSSDITIQIPFPGQVTPEGKVAARMQEENETKGTWTASLFLMQAGLTSQPGGFGMHPVAQAGADQFDGYNPPRFFELPEIKFIHSEVDEGLSKDIVNVQDSYQWSFKPVARLGKEATLVWSADLGERTDKDIYLFDHEQMKLIDMKETDTYVFTMSDKTEFQISYGADASHINLVEDAVMGEPYPNPFTENDALHINLGLSDRNQQYTIELQVLNALGQLHAKDEKKLPPGIQTVDFDLTDSPRGILFYRIKISAGNFSSIQTGKLFRK